MAGAAPIDYSYDAAGNITTAGAITDTRDPATGWIVKRTLGSLTEALGYNQFGEPTSVVVTGPHGQVAAITEQRDGLGRVVTWHLGDGQRRHHHHLRLRRGRPGDQRNDRRRHYELHLRRSREHHRHHPAGHADGRPTATTSATSSSALARPATATTPPAGSSPRRPPRARPPTVMTPPATCCRWPPRTRPPSPTRSMPRVAGWPVRRAAPPPASWPTSTGSGRLLSFRPAAR